MELVTKRDGGLFPKPAEITMHCSCPDSAGVCKHIAAVMYGVGARLDQRPELLFALRKVDHLELIAAAGAPSMAAGSAAAETIAAEDLADVFGIEMEAPAEAAPVIESVAPKTTISAPGNGRSGEARPPTGVRIHRNVHARQRMRRNSRGLIRR